MHRYVCLLFAAAQISAAASCSSVVRPPGIQTVQPIEHPMTMHAKGTFDVALKPLELHQKVDGPSGSLGRMSIDKRFHGGIEGTSVGEMLTAFGGGGVKGSAGYVAVERVTGTVGGKKGSFILQHSATMNRGVPEQSIVVVPDSGTEDLVGLSGTFTITVVAGTHEYDLAYTLGR